MAGIIRKIKAKLGLSSTKDVLLNPIVFDPEYYRNENNLTDDYLSVPGKLEEHWLKEGIHQGLDSSPVFHVKFYLERFEDLKLRFGEDYLSAAQHWVEHGLKEGRQGSPIFDVVFYCDKFADIRKAVKNDRQQAALHFLNYGRKEMRTGVDLVKNYPRLDYGKISDEEKQVYFHSTVFQIEYYKRINNLAPKGIKTRGDILQHWLNEGIANGLPASPLFQAKYYLWLNGHLRQVFGEDYRKAIKHWVNSGYREALPASPVFWTTYYCEKNTDLVFHFNKDFRKITTHYLTAGFRENRLAVPSYSEAENYYPKEKLALFRENKAIDFSKKRDEIISKNRAQDHTLSSNQPFVSIIILTRNGLHHLERLFSSLIENTIYPNWEVIVADNDSSDGSVEYLKGLKEERLTHILQNKENLSFSRGNNEASQKASGEIFLFLNNDVDPLYGWLNQLVKGYFELGPEKAGSLGSKLIYPFKEAAIQSLTIQHRGINFRKEIGFIRPLNMGTGQDPLAPEAALYNQRASVTAACVLLSRERFKEVEGFDEQYLYGYEDVDLSLKLLSRGYQNVVCNRSQLFHYEFGTQKEDSGKEVQQRRQNNIDVFRHKWYRFLNEGILSSKINFTKEAQPHLSDGPLTIGILVTEYGENSVAGDYFTAMELAMFVEKFGWKIEYLTLAEHGYHVPSHIDVLLVLLHNYEIRRVKSYNPGLITVAWARNWFDRWVAQPGFQKYDIVIASSPSAVNYFNDKANINNTFLMPIAGNHQRYASDNSVELRQEERSQYTCDYCFTGSYWNNPRDIVQFLDPRNLPEFTFHLYGKNWERIEKFAPYNKGFVTYEEMKKIYNCTKILIDDANHVTKPWGSVNSRVFDALLNNVLVITNGVSGAEETFKGLLPTYSSAEELTSKIRFYLENEDARNEKVAELKAFVLESHTYEHRAAQFREIFVKETAKTSVCIKIPAPYWEEAHAWGDYHMALGLKKALEKQNCRVMLQTLYEWDDAQGQDCDAVIVLRGLSIYTPRPHQINIMWNISHPDKVKTDEYNQYDHVFVASDKWANKLKKELSTNVSCLYQCADTQLFHPPVDPVAQPVLFVGNSRKVFRKVIKDLYPTDFDLAIYGNHWKEFVEEKFIKGNHIPNRDLHKYYGGATVLLNDHWDDMREKGFVSNRLFDALACNAVIISDHLPEIEQLFDGRVLTYKTPKELKNTIRMLLEDPDRRSQINPDGYDFVKSHHSFDSRSKEILKVILKGIKEK